MICFSISLIITALLIVTYSIPAVAYSGNGNGTADAPYQISTFEEMNEIRYDLSAHYILMNDLSMNGSDQQWELIGYSDNPFTGTFNGNMKIIKNINIGSPGPENVNQYIGLFGVTSENAVISNLTLMYVTIGNNSTLNNRQDLQYSGSFVGYNKGTVTNCRVIGTVIFSNWNAGGLVGSNVGVIENCSAEGSITGVTAGGLVGSNGNIGMIQTSFSNATVVGLRDAGGLVGINWGDISNCMSEGSVFGDYMAGGFAGGNLPGTIEYCYTKSTVDGQTHVGGFIGVNQGYLNNCISMNAYINNTPRIRIESSPQLPFIKIVFGAGEPIGRIACVSFPSFPGEYPQTMRNIYSWEETETNRWRFAAVNGIIVQTEEMKSFPGSVWSEWNQTIWEKGEDGFPVIKQE
jgi:hypothetical protein